MHMYVHSTHNLQQLRACNYTYYTVLNFLSKAYDVIALHVYVCTYVLHACQSAWQEGDIVQWTFYTRHQLDVTQLRTTLTTPTYVHYQAV